MHWNSDESSRRRRLSDSISRYKKHTHSCTPEHTMHLQSYIYNHTHRKTFFDIMPKKMQDNTPDLKKKKKNSGEGNMKLISS